MDRKVKPMSVTQNEKAVRFHALHDGPGAFVIPNPWDVGSARILAGLGFQALATSSAASAAALGRRDGGLTRDEALAHARLIVEATDLPVSADLEKGFGDAPEVVAETIRLAAEAGLVGCTIEDATGNQQRPLYDVGLAVERIAAAAQAARALQFSFILTARAHNLLYANPSLDDTIKRLQAFEKAGADVIQGVPLIKGYGASHQNGLLLLFISQLPSIREGQLSDPLFWPIQKIRKVLAKSIEQPLVLIWEGYL